MILVDTTGNFLANLNKLKTNKYFIHIVYGFT